MGSRKAWILLLAIATVVAFVQATNDTDSSGEEGKEKPTGKVFSIFSVVTFKNDGCRSNSALTSGQSPFRNGTCFESSKCTSMGGVASGNCASGFGVCCLFTVSTSGSTVNQNCTYVRNPGFPTALTATTAITYTVNKIQSDICWLRLDFETFSLAGPVGTAEANGGVCTDRFAVTSSTNQAISQICGLNTGQHIYVEMGPGNTDTAQLGFTFDSTQTATTRSYEIKVSQIQCSNPNRPPAGCLQYWTATVGRITTFNFNHPTTATQQHLANQDVTACIRRNQGYCCVQYTVCEGVIGAFSLDSKVAGANSDTTQGLQDTSCTLDYVSIPSSSTSCTSTSNLFTKYCGNNLGAGSFNTNQPICDCTAPFRVNFRTDGAADTKSADQSNRGVCLDYEQIPCTNS